MVSVPSRYKSDATLSWIHCLSVLMPTVHILRFIHVPPPPLPSKPILSPSPMEPPIGPGPTTTAASPSTSPSPSSPSSTPATTTPTGMELNPLQRLFEPLLPRQPHLLLLILGYLPRLEQQLRVIQRPQLFDPILDVFAFRVVIMCLFFSQENISMA